MNLRARRVTTGIMISAAGAVAALLFRLLVVGPAYTPLPDGSYGEMFGPVSFARIPVYVACGLLIVAGLARIAAGTVARGGSSN